jgi:hypothetical protein
MCAATASLFAHQAGQASAIWRVVVGVKARRRSFLPGFENRPGFGPFHFGCRLLVGNKHGALPALALAQSLYALPCYARCRGPSDAVRG